MHVTKRLIFFELDSSHTLIINSLSGAIDQVSNDLATQLRAALKHPTRSVESELPPAVTTHLKQRGYLFDTPQDEERYLQDIYAKWQRAVAHTPTKFVICPTYSCNLRCTYCYEGTLGVENKAVLQPERLDAILSAVDEIRAQRGISRWLFELFGGEPLQASTQPIVRDLLQRLQERHEALAIVTNGTHILAARDLFVTFADTIDSVQITLDGLQAVHDARRKYASGRGTFDEIVSVIDFLLERDVHVRLRVNVDRQNVAQLPGLVQFIEGKSWSCYRNFACDIAPVTFHTRRVQSPDVLAEDEAVRLILDAFPDMAHLTSVFNFGMFRVLNHVTSVLEPSRQHMTILPTFNYCEANNLHAYVFGPDRYVYACPDAIVDSRYAIGTYFPRLRLDAQSQAYWQRDILGTPQCRECPVATFCGGGCALVPLENGQSGPACNRAQETLLAYLHAWQASQGAATEQGAE
jgi:uncharacterized protein